MLPVLRRAAGALQRASLVQRPKWLPWALLVLLLLFTQGVLLRLAFRYERDRVQERLDHLAAAAANDLRRLLQQDLEQLQYIQLDLQAGGDGAARMASVLREHREILRIERRAPGSLAVLSTTISLYDPRTAQTPLKREEQQGETLAACRAAEHLAAPRISGSYFLVSGERLGIEVIDVCIPAPPGSTAAGFIVATLSLAGAMERALQHDVLREHAARLTTSDGSRLVAIGPHVRMGAPQAERLLDVGGFAANLQLQTHQVPRRFPEPATMLVLALSLALGAVVVMLIRDVRQRAKAESALSDALALRSAIDNSLVTGLRARDLQGRLTYVNPAFCRMVGYEPAELLHTSSPPYWPADRRDEYQARQKLRLSGAGTQGAPVETEFQRRNGERFPAEVHEAPLIDAEGRQTGWLSAIIDLTGQRRSEELLRQQQDKLQASARLAMLGEMASLLSHELNQPLAAIVSYAHGTLNMIDDPAPHGDDEMRALARHAMQRIADQGERAGRVIKSIHAYVRQRQTQRDSRPARQLIESVLPLVRMQARKSGASVRVDLPPTTPALLCDVTMIEQVLLNLSRNALQAMEMQAAPARRQVLSLEVRVLDTAEVEFAVADTGPGLSAEVEQRLFTPFFSTRVDGLGLGLTMCRTVVEQHGGRLEHINLTDAGGLVCGARFCFTLPLPTTTPHKETPP
jgi:two-component system sensor histidine kinase DctS